MGQKDAGVSTGRQLSSTHGSPEMTEHFIPASSDGGGKRKHHIIFKTPHFTQPRPHPPAASACSVPTWCRGASPKLHCAAGSLRRLPVFNDAEFN